MFPEELENKAINVLELARKKSWKIATAESCTGGLIGGILTEIAGSSDVFDRSYVTYTNSAKQDLLDVPKNDLRRHGAVSEVVARAMADGALAKSGAQIVVAVTGIAGPGGGSADKPVGRVHLSAKAIGKTQTHRQMDYGDLGRSAVRLATVATALEMLEEIMSGE